MRTCCGWRTRLLATVDFTCSASLRQYKTENVKLFILNCCTLVAFPTEHLTNFIALIGRLTFPDKIKFEARLVDFEAGLWTKVKLR